MSAKKLAQWLDRKVQVRANFTGGTVTVPCTVHDAKTQWGNTYIQVEPIGGTGKAWVSADRARFDDTPLCGECGAADAACRC